MGVAVSGSPGGREWQWVEVAMSGSVSRWATLGVAVDGIGDD